VSGFLHLREKEIEMTKEQRKEFELRACEANFRAIDLDSKVAVARAALEKANQDKTAAEVALYKINEEWMRADEICILFRKLTQALDLENNL
jgi:hypothetical protein